MVRKLQARNEPRKGRGFGFVTLPSEELQQLAVTEMNGKEVEGREIAVKVAIDSPGREDEPLHALDGDGDGAEQPAEPTPEAA
jgi:RNA recognition motif-containing protein